MSICASGRGFTVCTHNSMYMYMYRPNRIPDKKSTRTLALAIADLVAIGTGTAKGTEGVEAVLHHRVTGTDAKGTLIKI